MAHEFHAIYENGVLRPVSPLALPELAEVVGTLQQINGAGNGAAQADPVLGLMTDEPELLDQVIADALAARERHPFRANH